MNSNPTVELSPPRIEPRPGLHVAGLVERYDCQSTAGIPHQWQRFLPYLGQMPGQIGKVAFGVCFNFDAESNFDYLCAVEVAEGAELLAGMSALSIPTRTYAIFPQPGHIAGIRTAFTAIWNDWVPQSGRQIAKAPVIERYGPEFNPQTGLGGYEIWIPLAD